MLVGPYYLQILRSPLSITRLIFRRRVVHQVHVSLPLAFCRCRQRRHLLLPDVSCLKRRSSNSARHPSARLRDLGVAPVRKRLIIDASYRRFPRRWRRISPTNLALGRRPGAGDGLFGQLSQLVGFDPTSREIVHGCATHGRLGRSLRRWQPDVEDSDWVAIEDQPASLRGLLEEIGRVYTPRNSPMRKLMAQEKPGNARSMVRGGTSGPSRIRPSACSGVATNMGTCRRLIGRASMR